jgi:hypothetical protein
MCSGHASVVDPDLDPYGSHCRNFTGSADLLDPGLHLNAPQEKIFFFAKH